MSDSAVTDVGVSGRSIFGVDALDASAFLGAVVWVVVTVGVGLTPIERALALAALVLVPLGVGVAATPGYEGRAGRLLDFAILAQPVGAVALVVSFLVSEGASAAALAAFWLAVTGLFGLVAVARFVDRGLWPLSESLVDAGFGYTNVGAIALLLFYLDITFWFSPVIVLLTAVHFHYAGFVLPVTSGFVGRCGSTETSSTFRTLGGVVLVGPAIIAVGISFSPTVELLGVGLFTAAVAALAVYVAAVVAPTRPRIQGVVVAASALTLPVSMLLAVGFVVGSLGGVDPFGLTISRMVRLHGTLNAFGFALPALLGWRVAAPAALD